MAKSSGRNRYLRPQPGGAGTPARPGGGGNRLAAAQEMLARAQAELASATVEGTAGGGAVRVTMNGELKVTGITISPDVADPSDVELLQDLVMAAIADATEKASGLQAQSFGALAGGLKLPGLDLGR